MKFNKTLLRPFRFSYQILLILLVFAFFPKSGLGINIKTDTANINVRKPTPEIEQDIFRDKNFNYKKDLTLGENPITRFINWVIKKLFGDVSEKNVESFWLIVRIILIISVLTIILFLSLKTEIRKLFSGSSALTPVSFIDIPENINNLDIEKMITEALTKFNYRLATRWWYLKLLRQLSNKEFIYWKPYKTNFDYYNELKLTNLKESFLQISGVYENVWYGDHKTDKDLFNYSIEKFEQFELLLNKSMKNA